MKEENVRDEIMETDVDGGSTRKPNPHVSVSQSQWGKRVIELFLAFRRIHAIMPISGGASLSSR
ncbi:MAG: hypothetical protein WA633_03710 [Stellaceae bacterium]